MEIFDFNEALAYIGSKKRFGTKPGLMRMEEIAQKSGLYDKLKGIKFIHIAGTNGKGSAAVMCSEILRRAGYVTGLYVSPFVEHFTERISVNGECIPEQVFAGYISYFKPYVEALDCEKLGDIKEFELITLAGLQYFADMKCEYVALEVGIGGRLDATNIIDPCVCLIMSVSLDHMAQLGNTLSKIAYEKCGIIKSGVPVVSYPHQRADADTVIRACASVKNAPLHIPDLPIANIRASVGETDFSYKGKDYRVSLSGIHQAYNAATVLEAMDILRLQGASISEKAVEDAFANLHHPARFEVLGTSPAVIIDGAHNEGGAKALKSSLDILFAGKKRVFVMGMCADHINSEVFSSVLDIQSTVYISAASDIVRAASPEALKEAVAPYCKSAVTCESLEKALFAAVCEAKQTDGIVVCFGSLFIANDIKAAYSKI